MDPGAPLLPVSEGTAREYVEDWQHLAQRAPFPRQHDACAPNLPAVNDHIAHTTMLTCSHHLNHQSENAEPLLHQHNTKDQIFDQTSLINSENQR